MSPCQLPLHTDAICSSIPPIKAFNICLCILSFIFNSLQVSEQIANQEYQTKSLHVCVVSFVQLFATPWTVGSSVYGISQAEYCSGLPFPPPGDLPNPGIEPTSPALQVYPLSVNHQGRASGGDPGWAQTSISPGMDPGRARSHVRLAPAALSPAYQGTHGGLALLASCPSPGFCKAGSQSLLAGSWLLQGSPSSDGQGSAVDRRPGWLIPDIMLMVAVLSLHLPWRQVYYDHPTGAGSALESYDGSTSVTIWLQLLFSCSVVFSSLRPHGLQHARLWKEEILTAILHEVLIAKFRLKWRK